MTRALSLGEHNVLGGGGTNGKDPKNIAFGKNSVVLNASLSHDIFSELQNRAKLAKRSQKHFTQNVEQAVN